MIKRPPIFIWIVSAMEREKERKHSFHSQKRFNMHEVLSYRFDTKDDRHESVQEIRARIGRTSWLPKQLWRYTWWWITACPGSLVSASPLDSTSRLDRAIRCCAFPIKSIFFCFFYYYFYYLTRIYIYINTWIFIYGTNNHAIKLQQ